jgi:Fe-S-cluster containining protein
MNGDLSPSKNSPWFKEGLRFHCTGCGKCCTGSPGYVFLSPSDLERLASHFSLSRDAFTRQYTRFVEGSYALLDEPGSDACIFLKNKQCSVYEARPVQCRTFPWWIGNLRKKSDWLEAKTHCEGIEHKDAPLVPAVTIEAECLTYLDNLAE